MRIPTVFAGFRKFRKCFHETEKILRSPPSGKTAESLSFLLNKVALRHFSTELYTLSTAITAF